MRQDVSFPGFGGTALHGWLYLPEAAEAGPGVVMAHGLSAVKEMALDSYAEIFCAGGLAVLVCDHRILRSKARKRLLFPELTPQTHHSMKHS